MQFWLKSSYFRIFVWYEAHFAMWLLLLIASQYMPDLLLSMRTFCMRREKWYMISLLAMGVPIIDGASLRQFCTVGLNISSKVSRDLRLRHFVDQKSGPFYVLILHCRRLLEHDIWHLVWWVFHQFLFHSDNCQCPLQFVLKLAPISSPIDAWSCRHSTQKTIQYAFHPFLEIQIIS